MAPVLPWVLDGILANVSQGTALATYFFIVPWNLQTVAVFSATTQVLFYFLQRPPVWIFVFWNVLQFCINTVQIVRLAVDTSEVQFDERELQALALTLHCFDSVPSRKIARVLRSGEWLTTNQGETVCLLEDGEGDHVHLTPIETLLLSCARQTHRSGTRSRRIGGAASEQACSRFRSWLAAGFGAGFSWAFLGAGAPVARSSACR